MVLRAGGGSRHQQQRQVERRPSDQARDSSSSSHVEQVYSCDQPPVLPCGLNPPCAIHEWFWEFQRGQQLEARQLRTRRTEEDAKKKAEEDAKKKAAQDCLGKEFPEGVPRKVLAFLWGP